MVWEKTLYIACIMSMVLLATCGHTQTPAQPALQTTVQLSTQPTLQAIEDELHDLSQRAGVIFAGQVVAVRRHDGIDGATGIVEVDFAVEDAVRGISGGTYTLREWAGLWPAGEQPFRTGQRYLMLLHAPGPGGLSSPIGGAVGAIPVRRGDSGPPQRAGYAVESAVADNPEQTGVRAVDLRWIATRVARTLSYAPASPVASTARPVVARAEASLGFASTPQGLSAPQPDAAALSATQSLPYASALALLRSWEADAPR